MNLLIVTQKMDRDDPILGFFHRWVEEFAKHCEQVHVICLYEGTHTLPKNVFVYSLGKESKTSRSRYIFQFYSIVWKLRKEYRSVFVHMNPEYIVLGGIFWRLTGKRIGLWYTHKSVNMRLRIATLLAHRVFTASPESFRLKSRKVVVTGHGIDVAGFEKSGKETSDIKRFLTASRISRIKNLDVLVKAFSDYRKSGHNAELIIIGSTLTGDDKVYEKELKRIVKEENLIDHVHFLGPKSHRDTLRHIKEADICLNASSTGSLDKFILEAMAAGRTVITSNEGARSLLRGYGSMSFVPNQDPEVFARHLRRVDDLPEGKVKEVQDYFSKKITDEHSLSHLIKKISAILGASKV